MYKRESRIHKGANTQGLQQLIINRKDIREEQMNRAILRVHVDHMEPLLEDKQMILIQEEQPAGSKCNQQQSLNQVIQGEQLENQWGGPPLCGAVQGHARDNRPWKIHFNLTKRWWLAPFCSSCLPSSECSTGYRQEPMEK